MGTHHYLLQLLMGMRQWSDYYLLQAKWIQTPRVQLGTHHYLLQLLIGIRQWSGYCNHMLVKLLIHLIPEFNP